MAKWDVEVDGTVYRIEGGDTPPTEQQARAAVQSYDTEKVSPERRALENRIDRYGATLGTLGDVLNTETMGLMDRFPGYRPAITNAAAGLRSLINEDYRSLPWSERVKDAEKYYFDYMGADRNPEAYLAGNLAGIPVQATIMPGFPGAKVSQSVLGGIARSAGAGAGYGALLSLSDAAARGELPSVPDLLGSAALGGLTAGGLYGAGRGVIAGGSRLASKYGPPIAAALSKVSSRVRDNLSSLSEPVANRLSKLTNKNVYSGATNFKNIGAVGKENVVSSVKKDASYFGTENEPIFTTPNKHVKDAIVEVAAKDVGSAKDIGFKVKPYRAEAETRLSNELNSYGNAIGTPANISRNATILSNKYESLAKNLEEAPFDKYITYKDIVKGFNGDEVMAKTAINRMKRDLSVGEAARATKASGLGDKTIEYADPEAIVLSPSAVNNYVRSLSKESALEPANNEVANGLLNTLAAKYPNIREYKADYGRHFAIMEAAEEGRRLQSNPEIVSPETIAMEMYKPVRTYKAGVGREIDKDLTTAVFNARRSGFVSKYIEDMNAGNSVKTPNTAQKEFFHMESLGSPGKDISKLIDKYNYLKEVDDYLEAASGTIKAPSADALQAVTGLAYQNKVAAELNSPVFRRALRKLGLDKGAKNTAEFLQTPVSDIDFYMNPAADRMVPFFGIAGGAVVPDKGRRRNE